MEVELVTELEVLVVVGVMDVNVDEDVGVVIASVGLVVLEKVVDTVVLSKPELDETVLLLLVSDGALELKNASK